MANKYTQNIQGTMTDVTYEKVNTPIGGRQPHRLRVKSMKSSGTGAVDAGEATYTALPGETIVKVKAIGNDANDARLGLIDEVSGDAAFGTANSAGTFSGWEAMEDADEVTGNFSKVSVVNASASVASYIMIWIQE
jgi:hypothetical protein